MKNFIEWLENKNINESVSIVVADYENNELNSLEDICHKITLQLIMPLIERNLSEEDRKKALRYGVYDIFVPDGSHYSKKSNIINFYTNGFESILENGHDWAQDHIAEAKNNMDQVFDFLMNESKKDGMEMSMSIDDKDMMMEGRKKTGTKLCARGKAAAKSKFDVYPSAYANAFAVQVCKGSKAGLDGKKRCSGVYC